MRSRSELHRKCYRNPTRIVVVRICPSFVMTLGGWRKSLTGSGAMRVERSISSGARERAGAFDR